MLAFVLASLTSVHCLVSLCLIAIPLLPANCFCIYLTQLPISRGVPNGTAKRRHSASRCPSFEGTRTNSERHRLPLSLSRSRPLALVTRPCIPPRRSCQPIHCSIRRMLLPVSIRISIVSTPSSSQLPSSPTLFVIPCTQYLLHPLCVRAICYFYPTSSYFMPPLIARADRRWMTRSVGEATRRPCGRLSRANPLSKKIARSFIHSFIRSHIPSRHTHLLAASSSSPSVSCPSRSFAMPAVLSLLRAHPTAASVSTAAASDAAALAADMAAHPEDYALPPLEGNKHRWGGGRRGDSGRGWTWASAAHPAAGRLG